MLGLLSKVRAGFSSEAHLRTDFQVHEVVDRTQFLEDIRKSSPFLCWLSDGVMLNFGGRLHSLTYGYLPRTWDLTPWQGYQEKGQTCYQTDFRSLEKAMAMLSKVEMLELP